MIRVPGQTATISGAVSNSGVVVTSGIVCPEVFVTDSTPDIDEQISGALTALSDLLRQSSSGLDRVMRIEAFLSTAQHLRNWNAGFMAAFPNDRPARTTLITGFALPNILIELQAIAACD